MQVQLHAYEAMDTYKYAQSSYTYITITVHQQTLRSIMSGISSVSMIPPIEYNMVYTMSTNSIHTTEHVISDTYSTIIGQREILVNMAKVLPSKHSSIH